MFFNNKYARQRVDILTIKELIQMDQKTSKPGRKTDKKVHRRNVLKKYVLKCLASLVIKAYALKGDAIVFV